MASSTACLSRSLETFYDHDTDSLPLGEHESRQRWEEEEVDDRGLQVGLIVEWRRGEERQALQCVPTGRAVTAGTVLRAEGKRGHVRRAGPGLPTWQCWGVTRGVTEGMDSVFCVRLGTRTRRRTRRSSRAEKGTWANGFQVRGPSGPAHRAESRPQG